MTSLTKLLGALLFVVACEKSSPVEATPGSATPAAPVAPAVPAAPDAAVATLPPDGKVAEVTEDEARAMANVMLVEGDDSQGVFMGTRKPGDDLARQIDEVRNAGKTVVVGGGSGRGTRGNVTDPPTVVDSKPSGRITINKKLGLDDSTLTPDIVLSKIMSAYMAGMKRCYRAFLDKDPSARGKLTLTFTVNESGHATAAQARGFAQPIDDCVTGLMASWRFPIPKDKAGAATEASFLIGLQLVPD